MLQDLNNLIKREQKDPDTVYHLRQCSSFLDRLKTMPSILAEILAAIKLSKSSLALEPASKSDSENLQQINYEACQFGKVQDTSDLKPCFESCHGDVLDTEKVANGTSKQRTTEISLEPLAYSPSQSSPTRFQDGALQKAKPPMTKRV
ncbi:hypothetical protein NDU88_001993 [Pleurodeles waltl]|uniref:Uncharacterized protein n=1 Tax=Pleurodeles waltl TaxID=8319 RepID=A0AAV7UVS9_PLEWA|nr:hypothetical protein NDU88_001993 [Pleurodeles waltl]